MYPWSAHMVIQLRRPRGDRVANGGDLGSTLASVDNVKELEDIIQIGGFETLFIPKR